MLDYSLFNTNQTTLYNHMFDLRRKHISNYLITGHYSVLYDHHSKIKQRS